VVLIFLSALFSYFYYFLFTILILNDFDGSILK
jgi:hypothetical protein